MSERVVQALIWIDCYYFLSCDCFVWTIFTKTDDLTDDLSDTNAATGFKLTTCLPAPSLRIHKAWHSMRTLVWNEVRFILLLTKRKFSFFDKLPF